MELPLPGGKVIGYVIISTKIAISRYPRDSQSIEFDKTGLSQIKGHNHHNLNGAFLLDTASS